MGLLPTIKTGIKTATIRPGEVFILPKGAVVTNIATNGSIDLTSTCDNLPDPEQLVCYGFLTVQQNDSGSHTEPWQEDNIHYHGIIVNGVTYMFENVFNWDQQWTQFEIEMKKLVIGPAFQNFAIGQEGANAYGTKAYLCFKTIPSIGENIELLCSTETFFGGSGRMDYRIPGQKAGDMAGAGHDGVPDCS